LVLGTKNLKNNKINIEEIVSMFEHYDYISSEYLEAKVIAHGFGLDPSIQWPSVNDYHSFCRMSQSKQFHFSRRASIEQNVTGPLEGSCVFCCVSNADTARVACGHVTGCFDCESRYCSNRCAVCRQTGPFIKLFKSSF
jgi:hypothetical protein